MAFPAFQQDDEEDPAGTAPGVAPVTLPPAPPVGMPAMPGVPPQSEGPMPQALPPGPGDPPPNPDALMPPGPDLQAAAPPPVPPPPGAAPLTPDGRVDTQTAEKQGLDEQAGLAAAGEGAERRKGDANTKVAAAESEGADREAAIQLQAQKDQQIALDKANAKTQAALDQFQTDAQKYRGMGLHDYWADKSTGDKVLAGLSMLFGAAGKTEGGPANNPGMGMIERAIERDFRTQQANIEKARSNVEMDKQAYDLGMTAKQQLLADNNLKKAAAIDAAAAQLVSYKLKQGVPLAQAQTDANVVALREKANQTRLETINTIHSQNVQDAHLEIEKQNADSLRLRADKYKMRGGGADGGGTGDAMSKFIEAASQLKPGDPVTPDIARLAIAAHLKPNQIATEVDKYRNSGAKAEKVAGAGGIADERMASKEADQWRKENGVDAVTKKQDELTAVMEELKTAPHNPLQQALAIEKAVSSARGGAASRQALDLALHHLGPKFTSFDDLKRAIVTKEVGEKQMENFIGFMNNQLGEAQREGKAKYDAYNKYLESQPPERRAALEAQRGRLFSGMAGFGGGAASKQAGGGDAAAKAAKAKAILSDPTKRALYNDQQLARLVQISQGG